MKKLILTTAAFAFIAAPAMAGQGYDKHKHKDYGHKLDKMVDHKLDKLDKDGDGMVSKAEYSDYKMKHFSEADTNADGMLSQEEMKMHAKHKMKKKWKKKKDWKKSHKKKRYKNCDKDKGAYDYDVND